MTQERIESLADKAETRMIVEANGVYSKYKNYKQGFFEGATEIAKAAAEIINEFMRISIACDEDFEHHFSELIAKAEDFVNE